MVEHDTNTRDSLENSKGKRLQRTAAVPVLEKLGEYAVEPDLLTAFEGSLMREPSVERHTALLAGASTDAQRASLAIHLQQTYGNQYVQRLVESIEVQAKLTVSSPDDEYEREADRVADAVTRAPASSVQRQAEEPEEEEGEEEEETVQTKLSESQPNTVSKDLEAGIKAARGSGQPLPDSVRNSLEPQLGHDFSQVHIHTDADANKLSQQLSAEAFTTGSDIFFKDGAYQPGSDSGKGLIAHELTHVVQQSAAPDIQRKTVTENGVKGEKLDGKVEGANGIDKARLSALKAVFEAAVVSQLREGYKALSGDKPDAKQAYTNVRAAYDVVKSLLPSYKGIEPVYSRLAAAGNAILTIGDMLEPHIGITRPLSEIGGNLNPDGAVMGKYMEFIKSQL